MAISHVDTNTATAGNGTSVTVTKPSGATTDDLLLAFFTSNNQNCSPPAGWTEIADEVTEVFRCQVFYKVAGGSEPANYTFSVASATPIVCSMSALRGIDETGPIDITAVADTALTHAEPYTTPSLTGGTAGRLVYFRTVRLSGTTPPTFSASGVTELSDVGVFSGGSVCYAQGLYMANSDYSGGGSKSGLAITCSDSETHNFVFTVGIKSEAGLTATMTAVMPSLPSVSMSGSWAYAATLDVNPIPMPTMSVDAFSGNTEGTLDIAVPIDVTIAASTPVRGTLDVVVTPVVGISSETRFFGDNAVTPEREERWFIMTQEGYYLGVRSVVDIPMRVTMPLPTVNISVTTATRAGQVEDIPVTTFDPTEIIVIFSGGASSVTATANDATVLVGRLAFVGEVVSAATTADLPESVGIVFAAETVEAAVVASDVIGASVLVDNATATVTAYNPTSGNAKNVAAEHVSVSVTTYSPASGVANAYAGHASVSVTPNNASIKGTVSSGHASVNCHN